MNPNNYPKPKTLNQQVIPPSLQFNKKQSASEFDVLCPKHQEKIIQVQINESEEIKMECQKCLTQKEFKYSVQELSQKILAHQKNELNNINNKSESCLKDLLDLKKCLQDLLGQFTQRMQAMISEVENSVSRIREQTKTLSESLTKEICQLQITDLKILTKQITFNYQKKDLNFFDEEVNKKFALIRQQYDSLQQYVYDYQHAQLDLKLKLYENIPQEYLEENEDNFY